MAAGRIDDAVRRVLRLKFQLGVFENPYGDPVNGPYRFHTPEFAALANQASRKALSWWPARAPPTRTSAASGRAIFTRSTGR